jgi:single-strand DNA-binding protein
MATITIIGNLTDAPELRFTAQGKAVANFTVAESRRVKDTDGTWKDGDAVFWRVSLWDAAAENMAESLTKGQRVIVVGEIGQRSFETNAGEKRTVTEVTASEVGPSVKWARVKVEPAAGNPSGFNAKAHKPAPVADDPWSAAPAIGNDDNPPF